MNAERNTWLGPFSDAEAERVQALADCTEEEIGFIRGSGCTYAMDFAEYGVRALANARLVKVEAGPQPASPLPWRLCDEVDGEILAHGEDDDWISSKGGDDFARDGAFIFRAANTHHPAMAYIDNLNADRDEMRKRIAELEAERDTALHSLRDGPEDKRSLQQCIVDLCGELALPAIGEIAPKLARIVALEADAQEALRIGNELTLETQTLGEMTADLVRMVREARVGRDALSDLVGALPSCTVCASPATHGYGSGYRCDNHVRGQHPLAYADALRAIGAARDGALRTSDAVGRFAREILHGDDDHRAWLLDAAERFAQGRPVPPPALRTDEDAASNLIAKEAKGSAVKR